MEILSLIIVQIVAILAAFFAGWNLAEARKFDKLGRFIREWRVANDSFKLFSESLLRAKDPRELDEEYLLLWKTANFIVEEHTKGMLKLKDK